jgi:hypothetical protein
MLERIKAAIENPAQTSSYVDQCSGTEGFHGDLRLIFAPSHDAAVETGIAGSTVIGPRRAAAPEKFCPGATAMAQLFSVIMSRQSPTPSTVPPAPSERAAPAPHLSM